MPPPTGLLTRPPTAPRTSRSRCAELTPAQRLYTITLDTAQVSTQPAVVQGVAPAVSALGNPATQYCAQVGGTPKNETRPDGGQYGVCYFGDNYVCEQWALMHGECPVGGVKVTGLTSPVAGYCEITGGDYTLIGTTNTGEEVGNCILPDGQMCDAGEYYAGACPASLALPAPPPTTVPIGKPNPASQNCAALGGTSRIETRGMAASTACATSQTTSNAKSGRSRRGTARSAE